NERDRQRKCCDIVDHVLGDRDLRALLLPLCPTLEDHVEGDEEEEQAAGDAESRDGNSERCQHRLPEKGKENEDEKSNDAGPRSHLLALMPGHADGERQEYQCKAGGVQCYQHSSKSIEEVVKTRHTALYGLVAIYIA